MKTVKAEYRKTSKLFSTYFLELPSADLCTLIEHASVFNNAPQGIKKQDNLSLTLLNLCLLMIHEWIKKNNSVR